MGLHGPVESPRLIPAEWLRFPGRVFFIGAEVATKEVTLDSILRDAYAEEGLDYEDVIADKGFISTGNLALDFVLGGGIARGRICALYGLSQSGKTNTG